MGDLKDLAAYYRLSTNRELGLGWTRQQKPKERQRYCIRYHVAFAKFHWTDAQTPAPRVVKVAATARVCPAFALRLTALVE